jgi:hypothetical protein
MNQKTPDLAEVIALAQALPPLDRVRLVEQITAGLAQELEPDKKPRRSLLGIWEGISVSAEEIDEARREMWGNFPREDI